MFFTRFFSCICRPALQSRIFIHPIRHRLAIVVGSPNHFFFLHPFIASFFLFFFFLIFSCFRCHWTAFPILDKAFSVARTSFSLMVSYSSDLSPVSICPNIVQTLSRSLSHVFFFNSPKSLVSNVFCLHAPFPQCLGSPNDRSPALTHFFRIRLPPIDGSLFPPFIFFCPLPCVERQVYRKLFPPSLRCIFPTLT